MLLFLRNRQTFLKGQEFNLNSSFTYCTNKNYTAELLGGGSVEFISRGHFNLYWVEKHGEKEGHTFTFRKLPDLAKLWCYHCQANTLLRLFSPQSAMPLQSSEREIKLWNIGLFVGVLLYPHCSFPFPSLLIFPSQSQKKKKSLQYDKFNSMAVFSRLLFAPSVDFNTDSSLRLKSGPDFLALSSFNDC